MDVTIEPAGAGTVSVTEFPGIVEAYRYINRTYEAIPNDGFKFVEFEITRIYEPGHVTRTESLDQSSVKADFLQEINILWADWEQTPYDPRVYSKNTVLRVKAVFSDERVNVSVEASPSGGGVVSGGGKYAKDTQCTITASANEGYRFKEWTSSKGETSASSTHYFTVYDDVTWTAHFVKLRTVTVVASPDDGGTVSGGGEYEDEASCTITATAYSGYTFTGWTSDKGGSSSSTSHTFTVTEDVTWTAHFAKNRFKITASVSPTNAGTASGSGEYNYRAQCTVSASKRCSPWTFDHWEDDKGTTRSSDQSYTFNVTESLTLIAKFTHPDTGEIMCDSQGNILSTADGAIIYNGDLVEA